MLTTPSFGWHPSSYSHNTRTPHHRDGGIQAVPCLHLPTVSLLHELRLLLPSNSCRVPCTWYRLFVKGFGILKKKNLLAFLGTALLPDDGGELICISLCLLLVESPSSLRTALCIRKGRNKKKNQTPLHLLCRQRLQGCSQCA